MVPDGQAYCTRCEQCKPIGEFSPEPRKANGVASWCRSCHAAHVRGRRAADPDGWRDHYLRTTFGISDEQFSRMLADQDGRCAICCTDLPWGSQDVQPKNFSVDHDHSCCPGKTSCGQCVRGLLCNRCNRGLGQFGDDLDRLRRAVAYLQRSTPP